MDDLLKQIKYELESCYLVGFDVTQAEGDYQYNITLEDSQESKFKLSVVNRDDTRLIILCEPQKYGKEFLENINNSSKEKRIIFVDYWKQIGINDIKVYINEIEQKPDDFINDKTIWQKFSIRYSKAPFFNDVEEKNKTIVNTISSICAMILSIMDYSISGKSEGMVKQFESSSYERNPLNRKLCLLAKGYDCSVCGMNFKERYGAIGEGYIHVHHALPLHLMEEGHVVDPIKELFPICPNCHSMLHRKDPPYTIDELKEIIKK